MSNQKLNSLDDFERFVKSTITPWSKEQRTAFAAAMAERWLPVYESFSAQAEWGDPATFQSALQSVWKCVLGHKLTSKDRNLHEKRVSENTPHPDDFDCQGFDCDPVVATSDMIRCALNCCSRADNTHGALMAMVGGFEAIAPDIYESTHSSEIEDRFQEMLELTDVTMESIRKRTASKADEQSAEPNVWQLPEVQAELKKQLKLLKLIGDMAPIDEQHIQALRQKLVTPELVGTAALQPACALELTNEAIFERYRDRAEGSLTDKQSWKNFVLAIKNVDATAMLYFRAWAFRYSRRKQAIEERRMIDVVAHNALLTRYSTHDAAVQGDPGWNKDTRFHIELGYQMDLEFKFDVHSPEKHHSYGPSLRRLWIKRRMAGDSDKDVWESVLDWACHRPPAWDEEDQRKKNGLAYAAPELGERLTRELNWRATDDVDHPWTTEVGGEKWRIGLNDFPDDLMYTLIINDAVFGKFHDWPEAWQR